MNYAGNVSCKDCFSVLTENPAAQLVDVRCSAEWNFVGVPDLQQIDKKALLVEWQVFPTMSVDEDFTKNVIGQLDALNVSKDAPIYFLCRSGVRSQSAASALTAAGYKNSYNVLDGFEGPVDDENHRGNFGGWKFDALPWIQR